MRRWASGAVGAVVLWVAVARACAASDPAPVPPHPTAAEVVDRLVERSRASAELQRTRGYAYTRKTVVEELGDRAEVVERRTREHAVTNLGGLTRSLLLRLDGREPSGKELQADLEREADHRRSASARRGRRSGPDFLDEALVRRFEYAFESEEVVDGRRAYVLRFSARPEAAEPKEVADRLLARLRGRLWVDAEEFELVKVESHLTTPLTVWGGLAATLTRIDLVVERSRLGPGLWMNRRMATYAEGRKLVSSLRTRMEVEQGGFREVPFRPAAP